MERLALGLVLLAGTLAAGSPLHRRDLHTFTGMVLDMAPTSFDDQYRGCSRLMEEELEELNRTEFADNSIYVQAWTSAARAWWSHQGRASPSPVLRPELAIALRAYTLEERLYKTFNAAVRRAGSSREEYLRHFHFKVLHFLLSEALRALRDAQPRRCHRVYRGVEGIRFTAQRGQTVRFGQFASTSVQEKCALSFGRDTVFSVETCYGVPISDFSAYPAEEEVLIPPFERFEVTNVTRNGDGAFIQLRSRDAHSTYNCEFVKEKRCQAQPCSFSAGEPRPPPPQPPAGPPARAPAEPPSPSPAPPGRSVLGDPPRLWGLLLAAAALAAGAGGP
ncbi:erythroblast NAD(P)(+)--arginine ADP-ribosyltransferase-like isoform X2 [Opisthocomus hoazin]|uniref:erythroblast NAD(P)(+)--arginine ADP-ribosyltransferase-like isoform X2 n=1 Tax=Opisthocomus hoazin TaxID=30419 RepID=UPI003F535FCB